MPAAARGALWRCESVSLGPPLLGGAGAWLYVTGRRSGEAGEEEEPPLPPHPSAENLDEWVAASRHGEWHESRSVGFVWAFGFRA